MMFWCIALLFLVHFTCVGAVVCNELADPGTPEKYECLYDGQPDCWVAVGGDSTTCLNDGGACGSIEDAKQKCKYNTKMHLAQNTEGNAYHLQPPANLTGYKLDTYFEVLGDMNNPTFIKVQTLDYDTVNAVGDQKVPVVLFLERIYTRFLLQDVTIILFAPPPSATTGWNTFENSKLIWIRDHATLSIVNVVFTGGGDFYPKHLFQYSGGNLSLTNTKITTDNSPQPIHGSLIYWDAAGASGTHSGTWTLTDVVFEKFIYSDVDSILWEQLTDSCNLDITVAGTSKFIDIQYQPPPGGRYSNTNEKGFVYTVRNNTKGDVKFLGTTFQNLNGGNNFAAPLVVTSVAANKQLMLDGIVMKNNVGKNAGGIFTDISLNLTGDFQFDGNKFTNGSVNDIFTETEGVVIRTVGTGCINGNVGIPGHDCSGVFTSCDGRDGQSRTITCGEILPEDEPKSKISPGVIATIIVVAVLVVAAIVVVIIVGVYFRKKKSHMQSLSEEDDVDSSSSSLHERGEEKL